MLKITRRRVLCSLLGLFAAGAIVVGVPSIRHALMPWTASRVLEVTILTYPPWGFSVTTVEAGSPVQVEAGSGRTLAADYFPAALSDGGPKESKGRILFVHGSIPKGRRFSPYRFLSRKLSGLGYHVLLPDIGGYGESRLPAGVMPTFGADVKAAADALDRLAGSAGAEGLVVIAHSLGSSMALEAVVHHGLRPAKLVLWDPPLAGKIQRSSPEAARSGLRRFRSEIQVQGGGTLSVDDEPLLAYLDSLDPQDLLQTMPEPRPRTLAALGSLVDDHSTLLKAIGLHSRWLTIVDLTGVDHFLNMVSVGNGDRWLVYRPGNAVLFLDTVGRWLEKPEGVVEAKKEEEE